MRQFVVVFLSLVLLGTASSVAIAAHPTNVPGRFCKTADIGKKIKTTKYGTIECKRDGSRARWKRL
jgi:hypothetical protein